MHKQLVAKPEIRFPETVEEARALRAWAETQDERPEPATTSELARHLEFLAATLPSKVIDEESGKRRVAVYARILGDFSNHALAFMARKACERYDWFPTPRQCLEILNEYRPPATDPHRALMLCRYYWQGKFDDFIALLKAGEASQADVDALPEQWRRIAVERGFLRFMPEDKTYVIRKAIVVEDRADAPQ